MMAQYDDEVFWSGVRAPLGKAKGLHPDAYTSQDFFCAERERVFGRGWVVVGCADEVKEPGRLLVRQVGERSILITRDRKGKLHAFINACRHRGTELAEADCNIGEIIRCPYHRWGYGLDGSLRSTPLFEEIPPEGFRREDYPLVEVRVETWGLLVYVCCDNETPALRDWLGDLADRMAGYRFEGWRVHTEATFEVRANWKLISENFQEYYHLKWVHPELAKVSKVADHYRYQGPGMYCAQTTSPVSGDTRDDWLVLPPAVGLDSSDAVSGRFVALFPNVILSVLPNHAFSIRMEPKSAGVTLEYATLLVPPTAPYISDEEMAKTKDFWIDVNNEDIDIVEKAQRGYAAGGVEPGPLSPRYEEPLHRFYNMLADCMTADSLAEMVVPPGDDGSDASRLGTQVNPYPPAIEAIQHRAFQRERQLQQ